MVVKKTNVDLIMESGRVDSPKPGDMIFLIQGRALARTNRFLERHRKKHGRTNAAAGGRFVFRFSPTGLGTFVSVVCLDCNHYINAEDGEEF